MLNSWPTFWRQNRLDMFNQLCNCTKRKLVSNRRFLYETYFFGDLSSVWPYRLKSTYQLVDMSKTDIFEWLNVMNDMWIVLAIAIAVWQSRITPIPLQFQFTGSCSQKLIRNVYVTDVRIVIEFVFLLFFSAISPHWFVMRPKRPSNANIQYLYGHVSHNPFHFRRIDHESAF